MPTQTSVFNFNKPTVLGDPDTWGGSAGLNGTIDKVEAATKATATTGSSNAYVLSSGLSLTAYATGLTLRIIPNFSNTGACTINVDGLGTKSITKLGATALAAGDLTSGRIYTISYDGTQFQVVEINSLDATLSTIAALTPTADESIYFTGTDTAATMTVTSFARTLLDDADAATARTTLGVSSSLSSTSRQTGNFNAAVGLIYPVDTTSSAITATLPASPTQGDRIGFFDVGGTWNTNTCTIGRNGATIQGLAEDMNCTTRYAMFVLFYDATRGWRLSV
jgi:hypothetical protein